MPADKLVEAIRIAARGESFLQPLIASKVVSEFNRLSHIANQRQISPLTNPLTPRETEILRLIARDMSNLEIAARLFITEGTVKNHVTAILTKLDARDRFQAVRRAQEMEII